MIPTQVFVEQARQRGFGWYVGVPCSFLTPFINYVIGDPTLHYVSAANEGDAVAFAAGVSLGGGRAVAMMQNSGLGNAVSPLTSLNHVFRLPTLLICTHRGAPGVADEPQHVLMGAITEEMFDVLRIPWRIFPTEADALPAILDEADAYLRNEGRPFALIMHKGSVAPHPLGAQGAPPRRRQPASDPRGVQFSATRASRTEVLTRIQRHSPESSHVLIATTGYTGRELFALNDRTNQIYLVGSMGCASSLGLGLALSRPDRQVVIIDGDGAALMRMGNFATLGSYGGDNLTHIVLDNEVHDSTGAQATVSGNVDFAAIAAACGYASVLRGDTLDLIDRVLGDVTLPGPRLLHLKIRAGTVPDLPRPNLTPEFIARRFADHLRGTS